MAKQENDCDICGDLLLTPSERTRGTCDNCEADLLDEPDRCELCGEAMYEPNEIVRGTCDCCEDESDD